MPTSCPSPAPGRLRLPASPALRAALASAALAVVAACAHADPKEDVFIAVKRDNGGAIAEAVRRGADPNARDAQGQLPLTLALRDESLKAAEALLAAPGVQVDAVNSAGETPLMLAALRGRLDWMRRLIERGAAVDRPGWTPLHYAATGPEPKAVALLLDRGAKIDAAAPNGSTPLMMAARYGTEDSVNLLLERGADAKRRNERGHSAADFARAEGRESLARRLEPLAR